MSRFGRFWPGKASAGLDGAAIGLIVWFFTHNAQRLCNEPPSLWVIVAFCGFFPHTIYFWNSVKREIFHNLFPSKRRTAKYVDVWKEHDFPEPHSREPKMDDFVTYLASTALDDRLPFKTRREALEQYAEVASSASFFRRSFAERQKKAGVDAMLQYGKFLEDAAPKKKARRRS
jgi:hypothetical protein